MSLIRIVYYSERNPKVGLDMRRLLDACERNNKRDGIGGFLTTTAAISCKFSKATASSCGLATNASKSTTRTKTSC